MALLEREHELTELGRVLSAASEGRGRVVFVEAPAGLGKTSLLKAAAEMASEAGFTVLHARASLLERDFAYGCVRQLLEPLVAKASGTERKRLFEGAASLCEGLFVTTADLPLSPAADASYATLHGLYWLLNNLAADRALVLSVDDLHWADAESLRCLAYLAPRLDGLPIAVIAATRSGERLSSELMRLAVDPDTAVLRPGPLSTDATAALCASRLGEAVADDFAAACREATGGNPFFLEALLREVGEQHSSGDVRDAARVRGIGPATVTRSVLLHLAGRPAAVSALVHAVAVLGDGVSLAEAADLAKLPDRDAASAADSLVSLGILKPADRPEFVHPIVREAVYADIGSYERAATHARAAEILAARGASEERIAAQIAAAEPAGDPERVELLRRVAVDALRRGAPDAAVAWLRRALAEPPPPSERGGVLRLLGSAELRVGAPEAVDHLAAAVELVADPELRTLTVRELALALTMAGRADSAVEAIESALAVVDSLDRELALGLEAELEAHAQQAGLDARAAAAKRLERHGDLAGATPAERLVLASLAFERARASDSASEATLRLERALADGRFLDEQELDVAGPFYHLVIGLLATDALDFAETCIDQALAHAQTRASIPAFALLTGLRARLSLQQGAVEQAETDAHTALDMLTAHGIQLGIPYTLAFLVTALIERDELHAAEQALGNSSYGEDIPPGLTSNFLLEARGLLHLAQGRTSAALHDLLGLGRRDELWGGANALASRWRSRASLALAATGDGEGARRMAAEDLARARRWGTASGIGTALRAVALVEDVRPSVDRLREAVAELARSPARLEQARALTDLGAVLRRARVDAEARRTLQEATELAERCGAVALAERARWELHASGGRTIAPRGAGHHQLTTTERRVAELAAQRHSNPEIAQALFVTRKTVETHLSRIYRKLDIAGRGELPRALAEQRRRSGSEIREAP